MRRWFTASPRGSPEPPPFAALPVRPAAEEIPLAARILTVADALDALTSDRPYRRGRPLDEALAAIEGEAGTQFCPEVVDALGRRLRSERAPAVEAVLAA